MSTMKKRFLTVFVAAMMLMALAVPAFAAGNTPTTYSMDDNLISKSGNLKNLEIYASGTSKYLNVAGSEAANQSDVTTYSRTGDITQKWYVYCGSDGITTIRPSGHLELAIMRVSESDNTDCILGAIANYSLDVLQLEAMSANTSKVKLAKTISSGWLPDGFFLKYNDNKLGNDANYYDVVWQRANSTSSTSGVAWTFVRA